MDKDYLVIEKGFTTTECAGFGNGIVIGRGVKLGDNIKIGNWSKIYCDSEIGSNTVIGQSCLLLKGAKLGEGATIDDNSVMENNSEVMNMNLCKKSHVIENTKLTSDSVFDHKVLENGGKIYFTKRTYWYQT